MMKKLLIFLFTTALIFISCSSPADKGNGKYDKLAIEQLDSLSKTIGTLTSCSYTLNTFVSKGDGSEHDTEHDVYMRGPDKMYIHSTGHKGQKSYWFDGKHFSYFSFNKNIYDTVNAPGNIVAAIDFLHNEYGIDFPAADFFYPTLTDDIINDFSQVLSLSDEIIDKVDCTVIEASNNDEVVYMWIEKDSYLPYKMSIRKTAEADEYYEAVFSNWKINPKLPDILFAFTPPANSSRVKLQSKNK